MGANPYPHLGWNPVPGIPGEVQALQKKVSTAAAALRNCHRQIEKVIGESSYWQGDAANAFRDALDGDLPKYLKDAATSLEKAAKQLHIWDGDLASNRDLAKKYDDEAREKKAAAEKAEQHYNETTKNPDLNLGDKTYPTQEEADAATRRLRAAERNVSAAVTSLNSANDSYKDVITKAKELDSRHAHQARDIAKALSDATDNLAPEEPGWLSRAVNSIWDGIKDVGQFLWDHAGTIGAIAGLLALLPTPLAPVFAGIAIAASAISMSHNLSDPKFRGALLGEGSGMDTFSAWSSVAGDAVGMIPGGKVLGAAGKEIASGLRTADEYGVAVSRMEKVTEFGKEVPHALKQAGREDSYGAWAAAAESTSGKAKLIGNLSVNGLNVGANGMSEAESAGLLPQQGAAHNTAEGTKAAATAYGIASMLQFV
jgi:type VII secretion system ESX-1 substrate